MSYLDISEGQAILYNPLPKVTKRELDDMIDWFDVRSGDEQVFTIEYTYAPVGVGPNGESSTKIINLGPGESLRVIASAAGEIKDGTKNTGLVVAKDEQDLIKQIPATLQAYKDWLDQRGAEQIKTYKARGGFNDEEMKNERRTIIGYIRNEQKAKLVEKQLQEFLATQREARKAAKSE